MENPTHKKPQEAHRQKKMLWGIVILMVFLILPIISALDFDNSQKVLDTIGKAGYPDLEIKNSLFLGLGTGETLWSGTLDSNTEILKENKI